MRALLQALLLALLAFPARAEQADWRVRGDLFGAAFGPVTYDRQSASSAAAGLDPQQTSLGVGLGFENPLPFGALSIGVLGRHYQPVENRTRARFNGDTTAYTAIDEISAQGFGLTASYAFLSLSKDRVFHPFAGAALERDRLRVHTRIEDAAGSEVSDETSESILYAVYVHAGGRWRIVSWPAELDLSLQGNFPLYKNAATDLNRHRTRAGGELGLVILK